MARLKMRAAGKNFLAVERVKGSWWRNPHLAKRKTKRAEERQVVPHHAPVLFALTQSHSLTLDFTKPNNVLSSNTKSIELE
ncbi:hypothetical protein TanjilG_08908 [Lupinus angustifolius]|uniref:Uncharacterized protein n=1 Tax=Lupinus angustifolius TaxID=3871 RepID=A0A4P1RVV9_LUPAN|nr:hypothetical protein TanjilG_08908 [Lupinus angustifolius]